MLPPLPRQFEAFLVPGQIHRGIIFILAPLKIHGAIQNLTNAKGSFCSRPVDAGSTLESGAVAAGPVKRGAAAAAWEAEGHLQAGCVRFEACSGLARSGDGAEKQKECATSPSGYSSLRAKLVHLTGGGPAKRPPAGWGNPRLFEGQGTRGKNSLVFTKVPSP